MKTMVVESVVEMVVEMVVESVVEMVVESVVTLEAKVPTLARSSLLCCHL